MFINEFLLLLHVILIIITTLSMLYLGKEALVAFLCMQGIFANLFVLKTISLASFCASGSDIYIVGSVFTLNLLQEYYGKDTARRAIWISFIALFFYTIATQIHICYVPSTSDFAQSFYVQLFQFMPRLTIASLLVYFIVQNFDIIFYAFLRRLFSNRFLYIRNFISIAISQLLDTILFSFFGLYGILPNLTSIAMVSYAIKMLTMVIIVPCVLTLTKYIKKAD